LPPALDILLSALNKLPPALDKLPLAFHKLPLALASGKLKPKATALAELKAAASF
jgi:hypothetical protein